MAVAFKAGYSIRLAFSSMKHFANANTIKLVERNYLQECLQSFQDICEKKYGTRFDLPAIEREVAHFRSHRPLTYQDLRKFESPEHWWFARFWVFPPEHHVSPALKRRQFNFWRLPSNEGEVISSLVEVFKSVELVSIILRFIRPEHYGIISPPVELVLDVRRGNDSTETYLNYLADLRRVRSHYEFRKASEADMALWVLHERCFGTVKEPAMRQAYLGDEFLRRLRAKNLMAAFLQNYSYVELADSLLPMNRQLAAQIAGIAFEKKIRELEANVLGQSDFEEDLKSVIDELYNRGMIDSLTHGKWQAHRRTRNKAIHGPNLPSRKEVELLIETLKAK